MNNLNVQNINLTVLLIDLTNSSQGLISCLKEHGYEVALAQDVSQIAQSLAGHRDLSAILINSGPANSEGEILIDKVKSQCRAPIIVIGPEQESSIACFLLQGADAYLANSVSPQLVISRMKSLLRRSRGLVEET